MRASDTYTESLFTMSKLEDFIPQSHPLRPIRNMVNEALTNLEGFLTGMYAAQSQGGRPAIAPEKLLRAMLLQVFYSIRSERQLMEQTQYNLLYRWFIGLAMDDPVWVPTVFTKNRARLLEHDAVIELFNEVLMLAERRGLLSGEHFSVDGTLIQAWASHKRFVRKDGSDQDGDDFKGKPRSNDTHASRTDDDARLYRKGNTASELRYMIKKYVEQSTGMLKLFYLPPYSAHLNPDETVWAHVKRDVSRRLVENKENMKQLAVSVLRRLQKLPILIMSFFRQPECRYILG